MGSPFDYPIPVLKAYFDPSVYTHSKRSARSMAKGLSTPYVAPTSTTVDLGFTIILFKTKT